jgi:arsenite/tail-anchored protein-transporting ATPase
MSVAAPVAPTATDTPTDGDLATRLALDTRFTFVTGKGGVGKTTTAAALAIAFAHRGDATLLVSTDPASNLGDLLGVHGARVPTPVPGLPALAVLDIDPVQAAAAYRDRVVGPVRGLLPEAAITQMEEQLSGACTVEIAAFDEFTALLTDPEIAARFAHIVFDTAPTGHTLRLLALPSAWTGFLSTATHGASCLGPMAGLERQRSQYADAVAALGDAARTTVVLVSRAERSPLAEAARAGAELRALGMAAQRLVINAVLADPGDDALAQSWFAAQTDALAHMPHALRDIPSLSLPLRTGALTGLASLKALATAPLHPPLTSTNASALAAPNALLAFDALVEELDRTGHGAILTMGKGGVGKTRVAVQLATALARRGRRVHLSTTDPAGAFIAELASAHPSLHISRIDPIAETARYSAEVLAAAGPLDAAERALLEEDLRSPCTEEIAVFKAFARTLADAEQDVVVLDTAPTGHTVLLLDAAHAYHRDVMRSGGAVPPEVASLLPRLRDPAFTRVLVVARPEATPIAEAERLEADLARAGIHPFGWVLNAALSLCTTTHPALAARAVEERAHIAAVCRHDRRVWALPWAAESPDARDHQRREV